MDNYAEHIASIDSAVAAEADVPAALDRAVSLLKERIPEYTWVGIYLLEGDELVLGPYRGKPSPHTCKGLLWKPFFVCKIPYLSDVYDIFSSLARSLL